MSKNSFFLEDYSLRTTEYKSIRVRVFHCQKSKDKRQKSFGYCKPATSQKSVVRCPLPVVRCPLSVVCCPLSVVCCPLSVVCCPLSVVRCLLSVVRCPKKQISLREGIREAGQMRKRLFFQWLTATYALQFDFAKVRRRKFSL